MLISLCCDLFPLCCTEACFCCVILISLCCANLLMQLVSVVWWLVLLCCVNFIVLQLVSVCCGDFVVLCTTGPLYICLETHTHTHTHTHKETRALHATFTALPLLSYVGEDKLQTGTILGQPENETGSGEDIANNLFMYVCAPYQCLPNIISLWIVAHFNLNYVPCYCSVGIVKHYNKIK